MAQRIGNVTNSTLSGVNVDASHKHIGDNYVNSFEKKDVMSNFLRCAGFFMFVANTILFAFNIYYICHYYPHTENLGFDYTGIIVGILSLLITMLVGWQILSNVLINKEIDNKISSQINELDRKSKKISDEISQDIKDCKNLSIGISLAQLGLSQYYNEDYSSSTRSILNSLVFLNKVENDDELKSDAYEHVCSIIEKLSVITTKCTGFSKEDIELFRDAAIKTGNKTIILFVMKFE